MDGLLRDLTRLELSTMQHVYQEFLANNTPLAKLAFFKKFQSKNFENKERIWLIDRCGLFNPCKCFINAIKVPFIEAVLVNVCSSKNIFR